MVRILVFILALLANAAGFAQAVVDGTISIGADAIVVTSFEKLVEMIRPGLVGQVHNDLIALAPALWDSGLRYLFLAPAFLVLWAIGFVLYVVSRKRRPEIGVSNRDR